MIGDLQHSLDSIRYPWVLLLYLEDCAFVRGGEEKEEKKRREKKEKKLLLAVTSQEAVLVICSDECFCHCCCSDGTLCCILFGKRKFCVWLNKWICPSIEHI